MSRTSITVEGSRLTLRHGRLRAHRLVDQSGWTRVALIASTALLLGGDTVKLDVVVGPGLRLELRDIAGTVAYDGRGAAASWTVRVRLGERAALILAGEPLVLADGANVDRTLQLDLARSASALIRETCVFGRFGEIGGSLRNRTEVRREGRAVLIEDQQLDGQSRRRPGILDGVRVMDTILCFGEPSSAEEPAPRATSSPRFDLVEAGSWMTRYLGSSAADSPLVQEWEQLRSDFLRLGEAGRGLLGGISGGH